MCGIFGIINTNKRPVDQKELKAGIKKIQHRGPNGNGLCVSGHVGMAACRLAIMDKSDASIQPFVKRKLILTFNGTIYNYKELRKELEALGAEFDTNGDTEVVLEAYSMWGQKCLQKFNGMWAIAIYDLDKQKIFFARDRFGIKPLYYTNCKNQFSFASEIKAFTALEDWESHSNMETVGKYLVYGMQDFGSDTMFKGCHHLPAGHSAEYHIESDEMLIEQYYSPSAEQSNPLSEDECIAKFSALLKDSIRLRAVSDTRIGASLSGGIDSSSIVGFLSRMIRDPQSFSVVFPHETIDESIYIHDVVKSAKADSIFISPSMEEIWQTMDQLVYIQDEPFSSASIGAQYLLFKSVHETGVQVMLDGQGADEILCGYESFLASALKNIDDPLDKSVYLWEIFKNSGVSIPEAASKMLAQKIRSKSRKPTWLMPDINPIEQIEDFNTSDTSKRLLTKMGLQALLHYADRNSMAFGIENRVPFLDYRLVDFCLSLHDNQKIINGHRKWLLKESAKAVLPKSVYNRKDKIGFETPQKKWMNQNRQFVKNELTKAVKHLAEIIDPSILKSNLDEDIIWRILLLSKWKSAFNINL